jgi:hypothetical protein
LSAQSSGVAADSVADDRKLYWRRRRWRRW